MSLAFSNAKTGGTNGASVTYTCDFQAAFDDSVALLFLMCNDTSGGHSLKSVSDPGGLAWQITDFTFSVDAASLHPHMALAWARVPHAQSAPVTATVTWDSAPGTCSIISVCVSGVNALAPFDPGTLSTDIAQNPTNSASQAAVSPLGQANLSDLGFGFFGSTQGAFAFAQAATGGVFIAAKQAEPAVGQARSNVGLYYFYSAGPTTTSISGGDPCERWVGFGTLLTDGTTPPAIFRARNTIIQ